MPDVRIDVTLRSASKAGSVKAHADIRVEFGSSSLEIFGLSVVRHDPQKEAWISYPQRAAKDGKKYFTIVKVTGSLNKKICAAVLHEFERMTASTRNHGGVERHPGEEDSIPF